MRILTITQPWAHAIVKFGKDVENRPRTLGPYRGLVAIHTSATFPSHEQLQEQLAKFPIDTTTPEWARAWMRSGAMHTGSIVGVARLTGEHHATQCTKADGTMCSPWAMPDHHHLQLEDATPLTHPITHKGGLGLRRATPELAALILTRAGLPA